MVQALTAGRFVAAVTGHTWGSRAGPIDHPMIQPTVAAARPGPEDGSEEGIRWILVLPGGDEVTLVKKHSHPSRMTALMTALMKAVIRILGAMSGCGGKLSLLLGFKPMDGSGCRVGLEKCVAQPRT